MKRLKGNAIYGNAEGAGNLLVFTTVKHQSTTSHIREQWVLQAESSSLIAVAPAPVNQKLKILLRLLPSIKKFKILPHPNTRATPQWIFKFTYRKVDKKRCEKTNVAAA